MQESAYLKENIIILRLQVHQDSLIVIIRYQFSFFRNRAIFICQVDTPNAQKCIHVLLCLHDLLSLYFSELSVKLFEASEVRLRFF